MNGPWLVILKLFYRISAYPGRCAHRHCLWPLRGTSDGHGSNRRPAGEFVVYKMLSILVYDQIPLYSRESPNSIIC